MGILSGHFDSTVQNAGGNLRLKAPDVVLKSLMDGLDRKSDLIVLLAHADLAESKALASAFPQIDVLVSGHERDEPLEPPIRVGKTVLRSLGPVRGGR